MRVARGVEMWLGGRGFSTGTLSASFANPTLALLRPQCNPSSPFLHPWNSLDLFHPTQACTVRVLRSAAPSKASAPPSPPTFSEEAQPHQSVSSLTSQRMPPERDFLLLLNPLEQVLAHLAHQSQT